MDGFRKILRCKIHRATVTHADLHYEGSITLSPELIKAAGLMEYEAVHVWNITRGSRFETYVIAGEEGSNDVCVNGAAAHLVDPGDLVIVACFAYLQDRELRNYSPRVVFVDNRNRIIKGRKKEVAGPGLPPPAHQTA